ncbi:MAG: hypothetical protein FPO08_16320 [Geobacter sp.]|nr:MAG: hypothetical protein FPO08_16320 [Geobacter sp.]
MRSSSIPQQRGRRRRNLDGAHLRKGGMHEETHVPTPVPTSQERQKTANDHPILMLEAENLRLLRELERHRRENRHACDVAVDLLTSIAEARDRETGRHVKRVQDYTLALGNALKRDSPYGSLLSRQWIERLVRVVPESALVFQRPFRLRRASSRWPTSSMP